MWGNIQTKWLKGGLLAGVATAGAMLFVQSASAITPIPDPAPQSGSYGLEVTKLQPPPTTGTTITTPGNGGAYSNSQITVSGICPTGLLIQVYDNGAMVGAANCTNGSFSVQITLFPGLNELNVIDYDNLYQAGPDSNHVTVSYNNANFTAFGELITLTSTYGRRAANPGSTLTWPLLLSGGNGPYAFSIDWGDGSPAQLKSQAATGEVDISHVYSQSGIYQVTVKVTDANGVTAFIQLVAIANGTPTASTANSKSKSSVGVTVTRVLWQPAVLCIILMFPTFWLGRRSELFSLHHMLEKSMRDAMKNEKGPSTADIEQAQAAEEAAKAVENSEKKT